MPTWKPDPSHLTPVTDPSQALIVCFNRNAAISLRRRLYDLVGEDARGVMVQTYHGLAMRLSGFSFTESIERQRMEEDAFGQLIANATKSHGYLSLVYSSL